MHEIWRDIPGFEGWYQVSSLGRVRRLRFRNGAVNKPLTAPAVLAQGDKSNGYLGVSLYRDGKPNQFLVHRLVLEAFIGPAPSGCECAHANGRRTDNRLSNLAWVTRKENHAHKIEHGTAQRGERNAHAKLSEDDVHAIRDRRAKGETGRAIAASLGVSECAVSLVLRGKTWRHVRLRAENARLVAELEARQ